MVVIFQSQVVESFICAVSQKYAFMNLDSGPSITLKTESTPERKSR